MGVRNPIKTINKGLIKCNEKATINIGFDAFSELKNRPADIILIVDRSSSMNGERIKFTKEGVNNLIDLVSEASGGIVGESISNGSRIGLVTFATTSSLASPLTTDVKQLKDAVANIAVGGSTNHSAAFTEARKMIDYNVKNDKIVIMFTDGITTEGNDPASITTAIKNEGASIYCIGIVDDDTRLVRWASEPKEQFVVSTNDPAKITELFNSVAYDVIKVGAADAVITEEIDPNFKISKINTVSDGTANITSPQTLVWTMGTVGVGDDDKVALSFDIEYIGNTGGTYNVNKSIMYSDRAGGELDFPAITLDVDCDSIIVNPDECGTATSFQVDGCADSTVINGNDTTIKDLGRIVQVDVPIKNVCPNKRLAVGVILTEIDSGNIEHNRGMKTLLIPPIESTKCENIIIKCVSFVVPEALDTTGNVDALCNSRDFKARVLVNYVDTDIVCCNPETVIVE